MMQQARDSSVPAFIALNFALAVLAVMWMAVWGWRVVHATMLGGDPPDEVPNVVHGCIILITPAVVAAPLYAFAGFGLLKRRPWGYYVHLVGACAAGLSCVGLAYTIPALITSQRPAFRAEFFPEEAAPMAYGFAPVMPGES